MRPPPETYGTAQTLSLIAEAFADKAAVDDTERSLGKAPPSMADFLCARALAAEDTLLAKSQLSSLLHSAQRAAASGSQRARLFAHAARVLSAPEDGDWGGPIQRMLGALYGDADLVRQWLVVNKVAVLLTRDAADAARVYAASTEVGRVCWGSVHEAVAACRFPAHLEAAALAKAGASALRVTDLAELDDDPRGLDAEDVIDLCLGAWQARSRHRVLMLRARFDECDADADGKLTVPEFWTCLRGLLKDAVAAGGAEGEAAEPLLERGEAEALYNQIIMEAELVGGAVSSRAPMVTRDAFVAVAMRRGLFDVNYEGFLAQHPEERHPL